VAKQQQAAKFTVDSDTLVTFQEHQAWQHLVPHSSPVWSHEETTVAKHTFNRCRCNGCTEDFLKQAVQDCKLCFLLHSFPRICREASALLTYEAQVVHCYWQRHLAGNLWTLSSVTTPFIGGKQWWLGTFAWQWLLLTFSIQGQKRTVRLHCEAKAKDLASEAEAKDTISWPRGGCGLEDFMSAYYIWLLFVPSPD